MSFNFQKTVTIAGGGFSGLSILAHQVKALKEEWAKAGQSNNAQKTRLILVNPEEKVGPGEPYGHDTDIYLLNQPAYAMSPYPDDPDHFSRWLQEKYPDKPVRELENSFQSRKLYGEYLHDIYQNLLKEIAEEGLPIEISHVKGRIVDAAYKDGSTTQLVVEDSNGDKWTSDSLVIADGHYKNPFLNEYKKHPAYFDGAFYEGSDRCIADDHNRVLIVGTGQDMMDRLSELHQMGYQGEIIIASRKGVLPWVFDPELYRDDAAKAPYQLTFFTPENCIQADSYHVLQSLWDREIKHAESNGYGPGHILGAFFKEPEFSKLDTTHPNQTAWQEQRQFIKAFYGNPTPQQRFDILENFRESGQLRVIQSGISASQISAVEQGFDVTFDDGETVSFDALFNSAACARSLIDHGKILSPLVSALDQKGFIEWSNTAEGILVAGQQKGSPVYYAGPFSYEAKWGCETFRAGHSKIARQSLGL